jgi:hypothetical protein
VRDVPLRAPVGLRDFSRARALERGVHPLRSSSATPPRELAQKHS